MERYSQATKPVPELREQPYPEKQWLKLPSPVFRRLLREMVQTFKILSYEDIQENVLLQLAADRRPKGHSKVEETVQQNGSEAACIS